MYCPRSGSRLVVSCAVRETGSNIKGMNMIECLMVALLGSMREQAENLLHSRFGVPWRSGENRQRGQKNHTQFEAVNPLLNSADQRSGEITEHAVFGNSLARLGRKRQTHRPSRTFPRRRRDVNVLFSRILGRFQQAGGARPQWEGISGAGSNDTGLQGPNAPAPSGG